MKSINVKGFFMVILLVSITSISFGSWDKSIQSNKYHTMIIYVESVDTAKIEGFVNELNVLTNKIVSAEHDYTTHQFTVKYRDNITEETIIYILRKYFYQYKILP